jgi:hypothetical protein
MLYKQELDRHLPPEVSEFVMSVNSGENEYAAYRRDRGTEEKLLDRFRDSKDPLKASGQQVPANCRLWCSGIRPHNRSMMSLASAPARTSIPIRTTPLALTEAFDVRIRVWRSRCAPNRM